MEVSLPKLLVFLCRYSWQDEDVTRTTSMKSSVLNFGISKQSSAVVLMIMDTNQYYNSSNTSAFDNLFDKKRDAFNT